MRNSRRASEKGFTLLEVMIAIAVLSLMSIAIYQVTTRSFDVNFKLGQESTDYVALVLSLQSVESDLAQVYSPVLEEAGGASQPEAATFNTERRGEVDTQPTEFWSAPVRSDGFRRSRLQGGKERITFIANNNRRVEADATQSDFLKVTWEIERNGDGAYSLYRTTDWDAFNYQEGGARKPVRVALLENLASASFSYYRKENKTWEDQWDSEGRFVKPESRFPDLIALKIALPDPTNSANQQEWRVVVKPNMALNSPKKAASQPQQEVR